MRRSIGLFLLVYGSATMVLAAILGFGHQDNAYYGVFLGATAAGCILAALRLYLATDTKPDLSKPWMTGIFATLVAQWAALFVRFPKFHFIDAENAMKSLAFLVAFILVAILCSRRGGNQFQPQGIRRLRALLVGTVSGGAVLVLLTLGLKTTEGASGRLIVAHRAPWITYEYDIARLLPDATATYWARGVFSAAGNAMYLIALLEATAGVVLSLSWRAGAWRLRQARWLPWLAGASCFTTFYFYNDIFWGWQSAHWGMTLDINNAVWYPAAGLIFWLAALVCTFWLVVVAARQQKSSHQLQILQIAQLPIAGFNFIMMPAYFEGDMFLDIPGLGILMIGSQLLTWGCIGLLQIAENEQAAEHTNP